MYVYSGRLENKNLYRMIIISISRRISNRKVHHFFCKYWKITIFVHTFISCLTVSEFVHLEIVFAVEAETINTEVEFVHPVSPGGSVKFVASGVNFSIFTNFLCFFLLKLMKLGEIDGVKFLT